MLLAMHILNPIVMLLVPILAAVWVVRTRRLDWAIFGLGAATFIASQALHIPFNLFLLNPLLADIGRDGWPWVATALLLGLSAGVFEETARYLVLRRQVVRIGDWPRGILFGLGHGGAEAIIVGLIVLYGLIQAVALRGVALESVLPPERLDQARLQLEAYWGMAWYEPLWGALERLSALAFHVLGATLVLVAVRRNRPIGLVAAILCHTLFNAVALLALRAFGVAGTELILAAFGGACLWAALRLRPLLGDGTDSEEGLRGTDEPAKLKELTPGIEPERLEQSKYL